MYVGYRRIAGIYSANPYLHTYADFADSFRAYIQEFISIYDGLSL